MKVDMSVFFEIAYAAANKRLCLFLGAGFSKELTQGQAPSWEMLLKQLCGLLENPKQIEKDLFPEDVNEQTLALEEVGQILALEFHRQGKNLHEETAKLIAKLSLKGNNRLVKNFLLKHTPRVITTNYDLLIEKLLGDDVINISPGCPIPRIAGKTKVYHIHGSVNLPSRLVITSDNYFNFINNESYFSRKLSTILHENTVVIMGYSMGDVNLRAIINEYRQLSRKHHPGGNIFFVARGAVNRRIKDYYFECYGVTVIDQTEVKNFFRELNKHINKVVDFAETSIKDLDDVLNLGHEYIDDFIWIEPSFYIIISAINSSIYGLSDKAALGVIKSVIEKKLNLADIIYGSWHHYAHLSGWIVRLGEMMKIKDSLLEEVFLKAAHYTMHIMSKENKVGFSWGAYSKWESGWDRLLPENKEIIMDYFIGKETPKDAYWLRELL